MVDWNEKNHDIFVKVCVKQVWVGNRPHTEFNKVGWANVIKNFNEQIGLSYKYCETPRKSNFLKNGKMVISVKIRNFSRSRMTKRTSPLELSYKI